MLVVVVVEVAVDLGVDVAVVDAMDVKLTKEKSSIFNNLFFVQRCKVEDVSFSEIAPPHLEKFHDVTRFVITFDARC